MTKFNLVKWRREVNDLFYHKGRDRDDRDAQAFLEQFQRYEVDIYRMAFVYVQNENDALDIVQETAYRAFKNFCTLKDMRLFKSWLMSIVVHSAIDTLRKRKKTACFDMEKLTRIPDKYVDRALSLSLEDLLNESLNEDEKTILLLKYYQEYTFAEISKIVDIPLSTVKSTLYRALDKIRQKSKKGEYI